MDDQGIVARFTAVAEDLALLQNNQDRLWGPPSFLFSGNLVLVSPGVKQQEREGDHPPST